MPSHKTGRMKKQLPRDATLRSIVGELKHQREFVRSVFANMAGHMQDCQVRLALDTGTRSPDYRVEFFIYDEIDGEEVAFPQTADIFSGGTHKAVDLFETDRNWSTNALGHAEIKQLHGELLGRLQPLTFSS